jgi:hypothetical protein
MAKSVHSDVLDAALSYISANADRIAVCSTEPTTYTELITTYKLAISSTPTFTGPQAGDGGGDSRKLIVDEEASITVDTGGNAEHVGLGDSGNTKLLYVTTCTLQALTGGNTVTIPAWDIEIGSPT